MTSDGTNSYVWDARNQLSSVGTKRSSSTFQYDAYGRRYQKTVGSTTTDYLYDGANPVQELSGTTPTANVLTGQGADQYLTRTDSAGTRSFLPDALGSTVALTDTNGTVQTSYTYEPYGNTTASGGTNTSTYQFTGRENDGTGLYYYRARYYNPSFGRFASEDPIGFAAGDPNLYAYAGDSPANATDPSGAFVPVLLAAAEILAPVAIGCLAGAAFSVGIDLASHPLGVRKSDMPTFTQKVAHDAVVGCLMGAIAVPIIAKAAELLDGAAGAVAAEGGGGSLGADFIGSEDGVVVPTSRSQIETGFIDAGFPSRPTAAPGTTYALPNGSLVRIMEPSGPAPLRASFTNSSGGPINPFTGKPPQPPLGLSPADRLAYVRDLTHLRLRP